MLLQIGDPVLVSLLCLCDPVSLQICDPVLLLLQICDPAVGVYHCPGAVAAYTDH